MKKDAPSIIETIKILWPCVWTSNTFSGKLYVILALVVITASIALKLSVPFFLKEAVNVLSGEHSFLEIAPIIVVVTYAVVWGASEIFTSLSQVLAFPIEVEGAKRFCLKLFSHIHSLSTRFHKDRRTGELLTIIDRTRETAIDLIGKPFIMLLPVIIQILFAMVLLSYLYDIRFGLVLLFMLSSYLLLSYFTTNWIVECRRKQNQFDHDANAFIVDSLLHAETVKYFNTQKYEVDSAWKKLEKKEHADTVSLNADAKIHLVQNAIIGGCIIAMTLMAGFEVVQGNMEVGDFVLVHGYLLMFMVPLSVLGYHIRLTRDDLARFKSAIDMLKIPVDVVDEKEAKKLSITQAEVQFKDVRFAYTSDREILKGITFTTSPKTTTAIVGTTGAGKSTIARLIYRLYDLQSGEIKIDGQNIRQVTRSSLRNVLGIVPQDTALFNDTLRNNLIYGDPNCSQKTLEDAIRSAHLEEFVSKLPYGLETLVGERGLKLSGGEKQRVAIARMLIKNPQIFIFDEATSALDLKTEREIQSCLKEISKNKTTIIIAHRLSTIQHADNILVLEQGEIIEQGSHEKLLEYNGKYAQLWAAQQAQAQ